MIYDAIYKYDLYDYLVINSLVKLSLFAVEVVTPLEAAVELNSTPCVYCTR